MALAVTISCVYISYTQINNHSLIIILSSLALTLGLTTILVWQKDRQFIPVLFWGMYVSLFFLMLSPHWLWELKEAFPVKPVAAMIQLNTPNDQIVYTSFPYNRSSLNFYSDRQVISLKPEQLKKYWNLFDHPYFLMEATTLNQLDLKSRKTIGNYQQNWQIITKTQETSNQ
jgi:hypothetical protein